MAKKETSGCEGYDDRRYSHSVNWNSADTWLYDTRAILRAQEEYDKAADAVAAGQFDDAAFYLGAMAHYIGNLAQYGLRIQTRPQRITQATRTMDRKTKSPSAGRDNVRGQASPVHLVSPGSRVRVRWAVCVSAMLEWDDWMCGWAALVEWS